MQRIATAAERIEANDHQVGLVRRHMALERSDHSVARAFAYEYMNMCMEKLHISY